MFRRNDYVGLDYYYCELIRRRKKKTPQQIERLLEHDREEERIESDPVSVMREGHKALDHGTSLLLKLIRSKKLFHAVAPIEKGKAAGVRVRQWDEAFDCLASRIVYLNQQLIRLAEANVPKGCRQLWFEAKSLAEAFNRLALVYPDEFRKVAEDSLTMPSVRARNPKFSADADAIIAAVHLAEKHPTPNVWDNKSRVGALCYPVVVSIIERIRFARRQYEWEKDDLKMMKEFHETAEEYRDATVEDVLLSRWHPRICAHVFACAALPDWEQDASAWWKGRVLPLVKEEFQLLARDSTLNPALWAELRRGGERNSENDMRRYMEKICKNKFDQIARTRS